MAVFTRAVHHTQKSRTCAVHRTLRIRKMQARIFVMQRANQKLASGPSRLPFIDMAKARAEIVGIPRSDARGITPLGKARPGRRFREPARACQFSQNEASALAER